MSQFFKRQDTSDMKVPVNLKVLFALLALGGKSDREIAKKLGINNSTLSRRRKKLEEEGYIKEYTLLPDFHKMGLDIIVFSSCSTSDVVPTENSKYVQELVNKIPEMLCLFEDHDVAGTNWFAVTVHRNYDEFVELYKNVMDEITSMHLHVPRVESKRLVFHTNKLYPKPFSLRQLNVIFQNKRSFEQPQRRKHDTKITTADA